MIIITQNTGTKELNTRPVQRTNQVSTKEINRNKDIYLIYLKSDMTGRVVYGYSQTITDYGNTRPTYQWSKIKLESVATEAQQDVYAGKVCFEPAGSWYYIIYEVHFPDGIEVSGFNVVSKGYAPYDNTGQYEEPSGPQPAVEKGVLGLAVEEGKLLVTGGDNITYTEHKQVNIGKNYH